MKTETIKASLLLNTPIEMRLIDFNFEVTEKDFKKGISHVYGKAATAMKGRLNIIVDEDNLREVFG